MVLKLWLLNRLSLIFLAFDCIAKHLFAIFELSKIIFFIDIRDDDIFFW